MINLTLLVVTALVSAAVAGISTLSIEFLAKPRLELRKEKITAHGRLKRELAAELHELCVKAASLAAEKVAVLQLAFEHSEHDWWNEFPHEKQLAEIIDQLELLPKKYGLLVTVDDTATQAAMRSLNALGYGTRFLSGGPDNKTSARSLREHINRTILVCRLLDDIIGTVMEALGILTVSRWKRRAYKRQLRKLEARKPYTWTPSQDGINRICGRFNIILTDNAKSFAPTVASIGEEPRKSR